MFIQQLAVFLENRKGRINEFTKVLTDNGIDITALSIADTNDFGILRAVTDNNAEAARCLREAGFTVTFSELIGVEVSDVPGGLHGVLEILDKENISIEYAYSAVRTKDKCAVILMRVKNRDCAAEVLKKNNIKLVESLGNRD